MERLQERKAVWSWRVGIPVGNVVLLFVPIWKAEEWDLVRFVLELVFLTLA